MLQFYFWSTYQICGPFATLNRIGLRWRKLPRKRKKKFRTGSDGSGQPDWRQWILGDAKMFFSPEGPFMQTSLLVDWWVIDVDCYSFSHKLSVSFLGGFADRGVAWPKTQAEWNTVPSQNVPNGHIESSNVYKTWPFPRRSKDCYPSLLAVASSSLYMTTCTDSRGNCSKTSMCDFHVVLQLCIIYIYILSIDINWLQVYFIRTFFFNIISLQYYQQLILFLRNCAYQIHNVLLSVVVFHCISRWHLFILRFHFTVETPKLWIHSNL